jgi:hypothetical protein
VGVLATVPIGLGLVVGDREDGSFSCYLTKQPSRVFARAVVIAGGRHVVAGEHRPATLVSVVAVSVRLILCDSGLYERSER